MMIDYVPAASYWAANHRCGGRHRLEIDYPRGVFLSRVERERERVKNRLSPSSKSSSVIFKFLEFIRSARIKMTPHLHVSMPHVKKLADFLVLLLPVFPLTSPGRIQGGLASSAVLELEIRRWCSVIFIMQCSERKYIDPVSFRSIDLFGLSCTLIFHLAMTA
jgi:hypothetical protein